MKYCQDCKWCVAPGEDYSAAQCHAPPNRYSSPVSPSLDSWLEPSAAAQRQGGYLSMNLCGTSGRWWRAK